MSFAFSQPDEIFSNTFDNPMYDSVPTKRDHEFGIDSQTFGNYVLRTSSFSDVDEEGYLRVKKDKLSLNEEDVIYEEIKS